MIRSVRGLLLLAVAFGFLAAATPSPAQPVFTLYDDFKKFDAAKWRGFDFQPGAAAPVQETSRLLVKGKAQLFLLNWGSEADDTGFSGSGATRLRHPHPELIHGMQAEITVVQATAQGCVENPNQATALAEIQGQFFNDGSSSGAGDQTGDVRARLRKRVGSSLNDRTIQLSAFRCNDHDCNSTTNLDGVVPFNFLTPSLTPWTFGQAHVLRLLFDQSNHKFTAAVLSSTGKVILESHDIPFFIGGLPLSDTAAPVAPLVEIRVQGNNVNCTAGATITAIQALFDNVAVTP